MQNKLTQCPPQESIYALLIRSEEKERSLSETVVYLLLLASAVFSIWSAAVQPFRVPVVGVVHRAAILPPALSLESEG